MSSPDEDWWSLRAAEYVIGTLRGDDLDLFQRILAHDVEVQAKVARWETRLHPLNASTSAVEPAVDVWPRIATAIREQSGQAPDQLVNEPTLHSSSVASIEEAREQVARERQESGRNQRSPAPSFIWPTIAMFATAASLVMGVLLNQQRSLIVDTPDSAALQATGFTSDGTSIVSSEAGDALWLVQTDHEVGLLRVTALAPPDVDDSEDYQLWQILPEEQGVASVGLLPDEPGQVVDYIATAFEFGADAFAVSREPEGGSAEAVPSGPVLFQGVYRATAKDAAEE